jgi:hypothetical protein
MDEPIRQWIEDAMAKAKRLGISQPVFTRLMRCSLPARAIYASVKDRPMWRPSGKLKEELIEVVLSVSEAVPLFREHAGITGAAVAALISRSEPKVACWLAKLDEHQLNVAGFDENEMVLTSNAYYGEIARDLLITTQDYRGPCTAHVEFEGPRVLVCGPSLQEVVATVGLVSAVVDGCLPLCEDDYKLVPLPVDDDVLAVILQQLYVARPQAVAEAIRVLRKRGKEEDRWLMRVLESRRELNGLASEVRQALAVD